MIRHAPYLMRQPLLSCILEFKDLFASCTHAAYVAKDMHFIIASPCGVVLAMGEGVGLCQRSCADMTVVCAGMSVGAEGGCGTESFVCIC
jgi:hypothetical protein